MIIIINKLQFHGKRFCENNVTGSNFGGRCGLMPSPFSLSHGEREKGTNRRPGKRSATRRGSEARIYRRRQLFQQQFAVFPAQARIGD